MHELGGIGRLFTRAKRKALKIGQGLRKDSQGSLNQQHDLRGHFCYNPFSQLDVYEDGKAYSCCSAWLPQSLGSIKHTPIMDVWNSPSSQAIRESILDGSFRYCDHKICPMIQGGTLPTLEEAKSDPAYREIIETGKTRLDDPPVFINLCNDASCNLYCPSCRTERIIYPKGGKEYEQRKHLQDLITEQLFSEPSNRHFRLNITGSGDPFASAVFREFLFNLDGQDFPNLNIHLQTNGVLLTPTNWRKMHKIHDNIAIVLISFDAATEATYKVTRPGGHWRTLLENTRNLGELRAKGNLRFLRLDFVVQQANYREMPAFVELGKSMNADQVAFSMVLDWGTWSPGEYRTKCIWKQDHPEFGRFLEVLKSPVFDDPIVSLGNLTEYRSHALNAA